MELKSFTCIGRGHGAPCCPATREEWEKMRREPWLKQMCERIEKGDEALKHKLPVWTPHCAEFKGNHRAIADAVKPLPRLMLDFDEKGHTDEIKARLLAQSPLEVLLIEESVRRGTHVLVELPEGMAAEEAQRLMAEERNPAGARRMMRTTLNGQGGVPRKPAGSASRWEEAGDMADSQSNYHYK
ncbi:MAG: hypothetical protein J1E57_06520 [Prevotella sp.]|nr:hypothetical protein [Prevotella sp.]